MSVVLTPLPPPHIGSQPTPPPLRADANMLYKDTLSFDTLSRPLPPIKDMAQESDILYSTVQASSVDQDGLHLNPAYSKNDEYI